MKVKTITCYDVYNHGASLQAYALMTYVHQLGHDVEIIDYKPNYLSNHYKLSSIHNPKWNKNFIIRGIYLTLKFPERIISLKRKREFDLFTKSYLKITNKRYVSNEELKNDLPEADLYICGSDQIWNTLHQNGRDKAFYLDFVPNNKRKIAYAASFATEDIMEEYRYFVKQNLKSFDGIGIRESSGVDIIKKLGFKDGVNVLDPVFLLDKTNWNKLATADFRQRYILIYDFDKNVVIKKIAQELSRIYGYKIYSINNYKNGYEDKGFNYSGPKMFVSLIKNAEFVISNSFHAAVFSIVYEKQFIIINRTESINTRMRDLLQLLDLDERIIDSESEFSRIMHTKINYALVNSKLKKEVEKSKLYLNQYLA